MKLIFFTSLGVSWIVCLVLVLFKHLHLHVSSDMVDSGPQKIHHVSTPRIGGIPIFLGLIAGLGLAYFYNSGDEVSYWKFLFVIFPVYLAGITEDFTKRVSPLHRLLAAFLSSMIGIWVLDARIVRLDNEFVDPILSSYLVVSSLLTIIAVGGVTHAINIIDGFNGLAGTVVIMILSAFAYVSYWVGDTFLLIQCLSLIGATVGFLLWNFPRGAIFAGDGGAYLWGIVIAEISVLLICRNKTVSPWFPVLLLIYPAWETIFSIYRRKIVRGRPISLPDSIHLHSLIYRRLVLHMVGSKDARHIIHRNSLTSPYLWALTSLSIIPGIFFWNRSGWLLLFIGLFIICYGFLYKMIVRFKVKRWMIAGNRKTTAKEKI